MFKPTLICAGPFMFSAAMTFAGEARPIEIVSQGMARSPSPVNLRGTAFEFVVGSTAFEQGSTRIKPELLRAIVTWLSTNYDLEPIIDPPAIAFVSPETMAALRYRNTRSDHWSAGQESTDHGAALHGSMIVAIYDDSARTMYLPESWTGRTSTELSVLLHEMVHHLQNLAGTTFACHEEREQLAYAAQRDWLALFGRDLFTDFGTDAFTLMARTHCAQ